MEGTQYIPGLFAAIKIAMEVSGDQGVGYSDPSAVLFERTPWVTVMELAQLDKRAVGREVADSPGTWPVAVTDE